jgi:hypothetical protein
VVDALPDPAELDRPTTDREPAATPNPETTHRPPVHRSVTP